VSPRPLSELLDAPGLSGLEELRARLNAAILRAFAEDGYGKSYEGAWDIDLPSVSDDQVRLSLHCYVVGPHRHYEWTGATLSECVAKARVTVEPWFSGDESCRDRFCECRRAYRISEAP
jgi:hypothetical protein